MRTTTPTAQSLPIITVGPDTVTLVSAHLAHVTSKSQPGMQHSVTDYRCSCTGFYHRNHCRHVSAVHAARLQVQYAEYVAWAEGVGTEVLRFADWFEQRDYDEMEPTTAIVKVGACVIPDPLDPSRWAVEWAGFIHGGAHFQRADAEAHAASLNAAPASERQGWVAMH